MKHIIAIASALALLLCCITVFAVDSSVIFTLEGGRGSDTATVTLSLSANSGISAASVNIIYDYEKVAFVGYENGSAQSCDVVSVNDNGFGQVRFAFCASDGYFRGKGELLKLTFKRIERTSFDSVVYVKIDNKAVFDTSYREVIYSCVPGTLTFTDKPEPPESSVPEESSSPELSEPSEESSEDEDPESFTSPIYDVDVNAGFITNIPPETDKNTFAGNFDCSVTADTKGSYVGTGSLVTAYVNGMQYMCIAVVDGDLNGNGRVEAADYVLLRRAVLKMISVTDAAAMAADMNGNGRIEATDYLILRRRVLKIN